MQLQETAGNCTQEYATGKTQENWRNVYSIFRQFCAELLSQGFGKQSSCHQWGCGAHEVSHHPVRCFDCNYQSIIETDSTLRKHLVRICRAKVHGLCQSCGVAVRAHPHRWCGLVTYFMPMTMHGNVPSKNVQPDHHGYNATSLSEYCWWLKSCTACHVLHCSTFDASPCNPHNFNVGMTSRVVQDFSHSWLRLFPAFEYLQC